MANPLSKEQSAWDLMNDQPGGTVDLQLLAPCNEIQESSSCGEEEIFGIKKHLDFSRVSNGLTQHTFLFETCTSNQSEMHNLVTTMDNREAPSLPETICLGDRKAEVLVDGEWQERRLQALMPDRGDSRASEKFQCLSPPVLKGSAAPPNQDFLNQKENFNREKQGALHNH